MQDRHVEQLSSALHAVASAISGLGISIFIALVMHGCMSAMGHH